MALQREILGRGWKFPFKIGGDSFSHDGPEQSKYEEHVIDCIRHRILTRQGERRFNRGFGTRLFELTFELLTRSPGLARQFIRDGLAAEPRIVLFSTGIRINDEVSAVFISADIGFIETQRRANLVFPFYKETTGRPALTEIVTTLV